MNREMTIYTDTSDNHVDVLIVAPAYPASVPPGTCKTSSPPRATRSSRRGRRAAGPGTCSATRGSAATQTYQPSPYAFKPWIGEKAIADGPEILRYIRDTAADNGIDRHIRYGHRVIAASWSSDDARWTVTAERTDTGETATLTCRWLFCASGYYRYDEGYSPHFPGGDTFAGELVHPQQWPEDLDVAGRRVVVIGSGATAVTLVPALAARGARVTMLQRSPSYVLSLPSRDAVADALRRVFGEVRGHALTRRKNILLQRKLYAFCQRYPKLARRIIRKLTEKQLPARLTSTHISARPTTPGISACASCPTVTSSTRCAVAGPISSPTESRRSPPDGIRLQSGRELKADIIVTATGLNLLLFGGMRLEVDGEEINAAEHLAFRGMMLSDIPNFAFAIGYTNSSWTLKVDLVCEHLCRLLSQIDATGADTVVPVRTDALGDTRPLLDFSAGYVKRSLHLLPRQGVDAPWHLAMDYREDVEQLRHRPLTDPALRMERRAAAGTRANGVALAA